MYVSVRFDNGITPTGKEIISMRFQELNLQESHLEEFIRTNINLLFEDEETLLVVGQQVRTARRGISDLTAIDANGHIVLIEIKRDLDDMRSRAEPFEFQAIRYAASYAKIQTWEEVVDLVYTTYIEKHRDEFDLRQLTFGERARRNLSQFLEKNDALKTFNRRQRILLIASNFDEQTLSAVAWLIDNGVDISCLRITPMRMDDETFVEIKRLLPPPQLEDYYLDLVASSRAVSRATVRQSGEGRTALPRMEQLFEWGLVQSGDTLHIKNYPDSTATAVDEKHVRYQGESMSYNAWGKMVTGWSAINIYEWTIPDNGGHTLHELRMQKVEAEQTAVAANEL